MNDVTLDTLEAVGGALGHIRPSADPGAAARGRPVCLPDQDGPGSRPVHGVGPPGDPAPQRPGGRTEAGSLVQYRLTDEEPLGSVVREILHLVKEDRQVIDDARLLEAVRRVPLDRLCRAGLDLTALGIEGRGCRRRRPAPAQEHRAAQGTRST